MAEALRYTVEDIKKVMVFADRASRAAWNIAGKHLDDRNEDIRMTGRVNDLRRDPIAIAPHCTGRDKCEAIYRLLSDASIGDETMQQLFQETKPGFFCRGIHDEAATSRNKGVMPVLTDAYVEALYCNARDALEYAKRHQAIPSLFANYVKSDAKANVRFAEEAAEKSGLKDIAGLGEAYLAAQAQQRKEKPRGANLF
jgi:hypothetical protein